MCQWIQDECVDCLEEAECRQGCIDEMLDGMLGEYCWFSQFQRMVCIDQI